ncbi:tRNA-modifying protein YgfZ, partial [Vibrio diabolicus]
WSVFRLFHHHDGYGMIQPKSAIDVELSEIKKYAIFSKVTIEASDEVILGVAGVKADELISSMSKMTGSVRPVEGGTAVQVSQSRWLLILSASAAQQVVENTDAALTTNELWNRFDIEA